MLVLKDALEYQDFLTPVMGMLGKGAAGRIAHDGGRPRDFTTFAVEHPAIDPSGGARCPVEAGGVDDDGLIKIGVQAQGAFLWLVGGRAARRARWFRAGRLRAHQRDSPENRYWSRIR